MVTSHNESGAAETNEHAVFQIRLETGDVIAGGALLAMAVTFWVLGARIDDGGGGGIGAADFPRGLALLLGIASFVLLANGVRHVLGRRTGHLIEIGRPGRVIAGMVLMGAFAPAMRAFGYYPTMAVFLAVLLWIADCRRPLPLLACVAGFLIFSRVVFETLLSIPLP